MSPLSLSPCSFFPRSAILVLLLCPGGLPILSAEPIPAMIDGRASSGTAVVSPDHGVAGEIGSWTVRFTVGQGGIQPGGGIRVQLPDSWHSGPRNSANRLQATVPGEAHYISARTSRAGVRITATVESESEQTLVKHAKTSLDGRLERYVFVVRVRLTEGGLEEGDLIEVIYGDRSEGSPGMRAGVIATGMEPILVALDQTGQDRFQLIRSLPSIQIDPGDPTELLVHVPSQAVPGEPMRVLLSVLDKEYNPVAISTRVSLTVLTGAATVPASVAIPAGRGYAHLEIIPVEVGVLRLQAEIREFDLEGVSNPADINGEMPERKIYWGDIHSHARHSWDGVGDTSFEYARTVTGLDFYALTDHAKAPQGRNLTRGLSEYTWNEYTSLTDKHHNPPEFVTIHAYEASFGKPYGHHNIYFRNRPGPLIYPEQTSLEELWDMLAAGDALTIPHHTGKMPKGISLLAHDPAFRRNFEIYSGHGLSEDYDPDHALSFENSTFTSAARSLQTPTFAHDAWKLGQILSTVAASDDHRGQPGQPHYGLTAARAPVLSRDNIFKALHDRHTYGTTGAKTLLEFSLDGTPMGQWAAVDSIPLLKVRACGVSAIERVELLKWEPTMDDFRVIESWLPNTFDFEAEYRDSEYKPGAIYYVRLRESKMVRDLPVEAWSSPIWTREPLP